MERHLLFVAASIDPKSGYGAMADVHCRAFFEKGIAFTVMVPRSAEPVDVPYAASVRYVLPDLPLSFGSFRGFALIPRLFVRIPLGGIRPTAVHSLVDFPYAVIAYRIARRSGVPFFFSAVGTYSVAPFRRFPDRFLFMPAYLGARRIFAISRFTADAMRESAGRGRPALVVHIPARPPETFQKVPAFAAAVPSESPLILSVGPLKERKGMDVLIRAMPGVLHAVPGAYLAIVAAYGDEAPYRALASAYGVSGRVLFLKGVTDGELDSLFGRSSVFAMTPRYVRGEFEGYGLVYVEAGWHKKPVVASRSGGIPDAVIDGKTGLLVAENDSAATAAAIVSLLTDGVFAARLGYGGYCLARARSVAAYAEALAGSYGPEDDG